MRLFSSIREGYGAENASVHDSLAKLGFEGVKEAELLALFHSAMREPLRTNKPAYSIAGPGIYNESELRPALQPLPSDGHPYFFRLLR